MEDDGDSWVAFWMLQTVGSQVLVKIVKNKHAPPFRTAQFELEFGRGICRDSEIIELGCRHKLIAKAGGAFYTFAGRSFRGRDAIKRFFAEDGAAAREQLVAELRQKLAAPPPGRARNGSGGDPEEPAADVAATDGTDEEEEVVVAAVEA